MKFKLGQKVKLKYDPDKKARVLGIDYNDIQNPYLVEVLDGNTKDADISLREIMTRNEFDSERFKYDQSIDIDKLIEAYWEPTDQLENVREENLDLI